VVRLFDSGDHGNTFEFLRVLNVVKGFAFPITRDVPITGSPDFCGPLPMFLSRQPHPPGALVENKRQTPIRKACQKAFDDLFLRFSGLQFHVNFCCFFRLYCSIGRGLQAFPITV
jgi:hypothetical protein